MNKYLDWTLKYNSKTRYREIVCMIDDNEDCFPALGWKRYGVKGTMLHNYYYMLLKYQTIRAKRCVIRLLHVNYSMVKNCNNRRS